MQEVGINETRHLAEQLDDVLHADQGTRVRSTLRMLTRVRNLRALKEIGGSANAIIEPIRFAIVSEIISHPRLPQSPVLRWRTSSRC